MTIGRTSFKWGQVVVLALALVALGWAVPARAQACCAAGSVVTPGRLALGERALVGVAPLASAALGSFDASRRFHRNQSGSSLVDFRTSLFATLRVIERLQVGAVLPGVVSWRKSSDAGSEAGGGLGDVSANLRYDILFDQEKSWAPGIGLLAGTSAPTGKGPNASDRVLASDVTGLGVWQWSAGVWLERTFGDFLVSGAGLVALRSRSRIGSLHSQLAPQYTALLALGYSPHHQISLAAVVNYTTEGRAKLDGGAISETGRSQTRVTLGASWSPTPSLRVMANAFSDPPLSGLGKNQIASVGGGLTLVWAFLQPVRVSDRPAAPPCHHPGMDPKHQHSTAFSSDGARHLAVY